MCKTTKGGEGFRRANVQNSIDINTEYLKLIMPLLPNYLPPDEWEQLDDKTGRFTLRQEDTVKAFGKEFAIDEVIDNTTRPHGKHFVVMGVG